MKEATGELNMTVITVVAIAAVAAFFYAFVWPSIRSSITSATKCANATCNQSTCSRNGSRMVCTSCSSPDNPDDTFQCSYEDEAE